MFEGALVTYEAATKHRDLASARWGNNNCVVRSNFSVINAGQDGLLPQLAA
jgi:hypothetical protein